MTDRIHSLTVALDQDYRDDDVQPIVQAIKQIRGVVNVSANVADVESWMAESRADLAWRNRLIGLIQHQNKGK